MTHLALAAALSAVTTASALYLAHRLRLLRGTLRIVVAALLAANGPPSALVCGAWWLLAWPPSPVPAIVLYGVSTLVSLIVLHLLGTLAPLTLSENLEIFDYAAIRCIHEETE